MDQHPPLTSFSEDDTQKIFGEIEEIEDEVDRRFNRFKNFDIRYSPPYGHHYLSLKHHNSYTSDVQSSFARRIKKERNILEKHIPSSIFVRAYEQRIDLMRAAISGPPGSDYEHCLFFFDISFPRSYPSTPPKVHYLSYKIDLNPNLRPDGKVCLTLHETWYNRLVQNLNGSNNKEKWNPKECNLLHVLHAIQNLIFNQKPNSREPSLSPSSDKSGSPPLSPSSDISGSPKKYNNEMSFVLACQKMYKVLRQPPFHFEDLVMGHFRNRAHQVLRQISVELSRKTQE